MGQMEPLPASTYSCGALGSIALSGLLMLFGRKNASVFVGLWPPTIALLGLFSKQLRLSQHVREAGNPTGISRADPDGLRSQVAQTAQELQSSL